LMLRRQLLVALAAACWHAALPKGARSGCPDSANFWEYRASLEKLAEGQAEECTLRAPALWAGESVAWFDAGRVRHTQGSLSEAAPMYEKAVELNPTFVNNLGGVRKQLGRYREAREVLEAGIRVDPDFAGLQYNLGMVHAMESNAEMAVHHLGAAIKAARPPEPPPRWHDDLAAVLHAMGRIPEALRSSRTALALEPTNT
jgi:tetratricopeptide (TPR) repeat protein